MRVVHIINSIDIKRGAERLVVDIVNNTDSKLCTWKANQDALYDIDPAKLILLNGPLDLINFLIKNKKIVDLFHFHLFPSFYFSIFCSSKAIIHEHGNGKNNRRYGKKVFKLIEKIIYGRAKHVIVINEDTKKNIIDWACIDKNKISIIPNFLPIQFNNFLKGSTSLNRNEIETSSSSPSINIGMVAAFDDNKKQNLLIEALNMLPNKYKISFAGVGKNLKKNQKLVSKLGLKERVSFKGNIDNIEDFYRSCDFLCLISSDESFGLVVLEAAIFGKRTICSNISGLRDVCMINNDLVLNSPREISKKILEFEYGQDDKQILYECLNKFSFTNFKKKLYEVYDKESV